MRRRLVVVCIRTYYAVSLPPQSMPIGRGFRARWASLSVTAVNRRSEDRHHAPMPQAWAGACRTHVCNHVATTRSRTPTDAVRNSGVEPAVNGSREWEWEAQKKRRFQLFPPNNPAACFLRRLHLWVFIHPTFPRPLFPQRATSIVPPALSIHSFPLP